MAESWVRLWAGMTTDPKFRTVARKSGRPVIEVIGLFSHLMLVANEASPRGRVDSARSQDIAADLGCDEAAVNKILKAMEGRLIDSGQIIDWARYKAPSNIYRPSAEVWIRIRRGIFERDDYTCQYCGASGVRLECDHVIPVSQGGSNDDSNLVTACLECNRSKGARTPEEWRGS